MVKVSQWVVVTFVGSLVAFQMGYLLLIYTWMQPQPIELATLWESWLFWMRFALGALPIVLISGILATMIITHIPVEAGPPIWPTRSFRVTEKVATSPSASFPWRGDDETLDDESVAESRAPSFQHLDSLVRASPRPPSVVAA